MPLFRRRRAGSAAAPAPAKGISSRRPHPGLLRRERRALLQAREGRLRDLGGLVVELYRRGAWRDDLVHERCAEVVGIDARLAEIDELLHGSDGTERCTCGAAVLRGSHFCPNCGRLLGDEASGDPDANDGSSGNGGARGSVVSEDTVIALPPREDDD